MSEQHSTSIIQPLSRAPVECKKPRAKVSEHRLRRWERRVSGHLMSKWKRLSGYLVGSIMAKSGRLSSLYYALLSPRFGREHQAFLYGRVRYFADAADPRKTSSLLRRSVHRLEKGLLMRPRRDVFALDYIEDAVACYERIVASKGGQDQYDPDELKWASDVLTDYFLVTGSHPKIDQLRVRFSAFPKLGSNGHARYVPYRRDLSVPSTVSYDDLLKLAERRRSVRWFLNKPVPRDAIERAMAVAAQSPSACNRQSFVFRVFDEPELVKAVSALPGGTAGFCHNFPAIVVVIGRLRSYCEERDRHIIYIDASLASMGFVYALETQGLSSCCINWPDIEERELAMERVLKLEPDERPIMLIAVGYPDPEGMVAYSQKKPIHQLCRFNAE